MVGNVYLSNSANSPVLAAAARDRPVADTDARRLSAGCRGLPADDFFLDSERGTELYAKEQQAKRICHSCTVADECLTHALQRPETYGI